MEKIYIIHTNARKNPIKYALKVHLTRFEKLKNIFHSIQNTNYIERNLKIESVVFVSKAHLKYNKVDFYGNDNSFLPSFYKPNKKEDGFRFLQTNLSCKCSYM